eukprot:GHVH01002692.1.p1 GENE.GHVH01002692.1~~GHVH01002692.1.p1  ORF type:complete len:172 (+),score=38.49 GHVH01002692.1:56-571(+)
MARKGNSSKVPAVPAPQEVDDSWLDDIVSETLKDGPKTNVVEWTKATKGKAAVPKSSFYVMKMKNILETLPQKPEEGAKNFEHYRRQCDELAELFNSAQRRLATNAKITPEDEEVLDAVYDVLRENDYFEDDSEDDDDEDDEASNGDVENVLKNIGKEVKVEEDDDVPTLV